MSNNVMALQKIVDKAVNIPNFTYPANVNAPRPSGQYATVKILEDRPMGTPEKKYLNDPATGDLIFQTRWLRVVVFDVLFSRDDVEAIDFANSQYHPEVMDLMALYGLQLMHLQAVENRTVDLETNWEVRAGSRVFCNYISYKETKLSTIREVIIEDSIFDIDGVAIPIPTIHAVEGLTINP